MTMTITSPAFRHEGEIPTRHTCEGEDVSPRLDWSGVPEGTRSLAFIIEDPDAPDPKKPKLTFTHWILYDLPPAAPGLAEGVRVADLLEGTKEGKNGWGRKGYGGPCPPIGRHRYFHRLYALDAQLGDLGVPDRKKLLEAIEGHVLAEAQLVGTYQKRG